MASPAGSSPRMRGKLGVTSESTAQQRIIPAHAGQTTPSTLTASTTTDHPRACGANPVKRPLRNSNAGSSPRMRGKLHPIWRPPFVARIIPAHAGQTARPSRRTGAGPDHPRACGANSSRLSRSVGHSGSSPRMRGKRSDVQKKAPCARIIPAHAGQTVRFYAKTLERWTLNNWIRTVAPIFVLLFLPPVIGQNAYIERHYSNQSFSWFSKLHYASAFDLSLVA